MLRRLTALPRRTRVAGAAALALVLLLAVVGVAQVRSAARAEAREAAAAAAALEERRADEEAARTEAEAAAAAEAREAAAAAEAWTASAAQAQAQLAAADAVLAGSAGQVTDDVVRYDLAVAMDAVRALLAPATDTLDVPAAADLDAAVAALVAAAGVVTQAQAEWVGAQAAAAAEAARLAEEEAAREAAPAAGDDGLGGPPSTGAGPDCGGPHSSEPPDNSGPTFYTSTPSEHGDGSNGRMPASSMTPLGWCRDSQGNQQWLRHDAAAALTRLNEAFRAQFGENIAVDMSYRSYEDQVEMREAYGSLAARPGTSNHGTGVAFDTWEWQAYAFGSARYDWLVANGPAYGWVAPDWARQGGSNPEYWHFEFVG